MDAADPRNILAALIRERGEDCAGLSRLIGRNPAYVQQYLTRGSPKRLAETDRATLARYFGVPEALLGGPPEVTRPALRSIPRLDIAASAGPGAAAIDGLATTGFGVSEQWLVRHGLKATGLSSIAVVGTSMLPTLAPGDEIIVDTADTTPREGVFVLRLGDALLVKRLVREGYSFAIRSDNPDADPVLFDAADPPVVIGRVAWLGRAL